MKQTNIQTIFSYGRVAGIAGNRHQGKTNNIISMIVEFRQHNKTTPIYAYGLPPNVAQYLQRYNVKVIDRISQLANIKNAIIILDEFQKLKLNDRRNKDVLVELMAMIYHPDSNNYVLFCSPTTREYNSIIGGFVEVWLLKSMFLSDAVNGSQLKTALKDYKGQYYKLGYYDIPPSNMVLLNEDHEQVLEFDYITDVDMKKDIIDILAPDTKKSEELSEELSRPKITYNEQTAQREFLNQLTKKPFIKVVGEQ